MRPYVPPTGDEPLDRVEQARVRVYVAIILRQMREEDAARTSAADGVSGDVTRGQEPPA